MGSKVLCSCCGKNISRKQEYRHRIGKITPRIKASFAYSTLKLATMGLHHNQKPKGCPSTQKAAETIQVTQKSSDDDVEMQEASRTADSQDCDHLEEEGMLEGNLTRIPMKAWHGRLRQAPCTDDEEQSEDEDHEELDAQPGANNMDDSESGDSNLDENDSDDEVDADGFNVWDHFAASLEGEAMAINEQLDDDDLATLRAFTLKVNSHMTVDTYGMLSAAFPESNIPSLDHARSRVAFLSGLKPVYYDCCINSCCCFVGPHADAQRCPYCSSDRYSSNGKLRKHYAYLPFTSRLKALYANRTTATAMHYRAGEHVHDPNIITDVFDGEVYRSKLGKHVTIDGKEHKHTYFGDKRDIALGLSTDGFVLFKRRKHSAWPLILYNYNLAPEIRFHKRNIIPIGVVPGPKKPVDFDSFLWPAIEEFLQLEVGISAWDALTTAIFILHAFLILIGGDIPAISMIMRIKGHNGYSPCRMCSITGLRIPGNPHSPYYVPLNRSHHPDRVPSYDPTHLPLRTHNEILAQAREVQTAPTDAEEKRLSKLYGVKGVPILSCLSSLTFPSSFPYDFMHLIWENLIKNLILLWTGEFKGLDQGTGQYVLQPSVWQAIGTATAKAGDTIPSAFGPRTPNPDTDKSCYTADSWSLWTLYVGPVLLARKFTHRRYYKHFVDLVKLLHMCLAFEMKRTDVDEVRQGFVKWVEKYEKLYYQYSPERLATCTLTIHALLHISDSIESAGPVWAYWAFPMERHCGHLQRAIKSRRFPYSNLERYLIDSTRLEHITITRNLGDTLKLRGITNHMQNLVLSECSGIFTADPTCIFLPPHGQYESQVYGLMEKIVGALATRFDTTAAIARRQVPAFIETWGKVKILPDGDIINAAALTKAREDRRDATYVRYEVLVDINAQYQRRHVVLRKKTLFGQLQHILVMRLSASEQLGLTLPTTLALAVIKSCRIESSHSVLDIHYYSDDGGYDVVDIACVQCLVGRVRNGAQWAIVDRSGPLSRALYAEEQ